MRLSELTKNLNEDRPYQRQNGGQIEGECGGTAFPFRFWRGNAVPLAQMAVTGEILKN